MKKSTLFASGFCLFATSLFAQQISVGARAGYTLSDVKYITDLKFETDPNEASQPLSSFHAGIDAKMALSERFSVIASLLYARKGYEGKVYWPTGPADATYELHYLNLPVVADFRIWKGLSLQGGVELGKLLNARLKSAENADLDDFYENFDLGVIAGLEYRFPKGFFVSARHIFGVYNIQELEVTDSTGGTLTSLKARNTATQISIGYRHAIGE